VGDLGGPTREGAWGPSVCLWVACGALGVGSGNPWVTFEVPGGPLGGGLGGLGRGQGAPWGQCCEKATLQNHRFDIMNGYIWALSVGRRAMPRWVDGWVVGGVMCVPASRC
jgi:hypothetical protein